MTPRQLTIANELAEQIVPEDADGYPRNNHTREQAWLLVRDAIIDTLELIEPRHYERVTQLLEANNREVERRRELGNFVRMVATLTDIETAIGEETVEELRRDARRIIEKWPDFPAYWRPRYSDAERESAASMLLQAHRNGHNATEIVDLVAEVLGMERAGR